MHLHDVDRAASLKSEVTLNLWLMNKNRSHFEKAFMTIFILILLLDSTTRRYSIPPQYFPRTVNVSLVNDLLTNTV